MSSDRNHGREPWPLSEHICPADVEIVERWLDYQRGRSLSPATIKRRVATLRSFSRHVAPSSLLSATLVDVEEWVTRLKTPRTRHHYLSDLSRFYRWCIRRQLATADPTEGMESVRVPKAIPKPLPDEAIAAIYAAGTGRVQLAVLLGTLAGLRISEIAAVEMSDVHLDAEMPVLHVRNGKGAKDRIVPLHDTLVRALRGRPAGWLFPNRFDPGRHIAPETLRRQIQHVARTVGIEMTPHMLRHTFGTRAAQISNGNLMLVGSLMGHASPNTTRGYVAWSPEEGAKVVAQFTGIAPRDDLAERRQAKAG